MLRMHPCSLTLASLLTEQGRVHGIPLPVHGVSKGSKSMSKISNFYYNPFKMKEVRFLAYEITLGAYAVHASIVQYVFHLLF